ncbi:hypothetical protein Mal64_20110 [Pseudobythopirellula maris]|uniref:Uncharacterized protein n=1 Tax=Pseudobythopirellula maris TaxID=2527991 RepID=A0A5C5ZMZ2_9BACT|nr:hypothetical protein [Pseudobythopirellula maris]TWT88528.1 hypothetical protein Mal64_20110 [Pseudobythopirellula maris]
MKSFEVYSGYRQFYVADAGIDPDAPENWTDEHIAQRHNTLRNIAALCPEGDITSRVIACGPDDEAPPHQDPSEFEVETFIEVPTGKIGVYGWPRELFDEYTVEPGTYSIFFTGHALDRVDDEEDYYVVRIRKRA